MFATCIEVAALCGFVFGVACKLPPALTILVLNGCFCFPIGAFLTRRKLFGCLNIRLRSTQPFDGNYHRLQEPASAELNGGTETRQKQPSRVVHNVITTILEAMGFLMQCGVMVAIPILLNAERCYYIAVIILLPISLFLLSFIWSGWAVMQKKLTRHGKIIYGGDRLKAGRITTQYLSSINTGHHYLICLYIPFCKSDLW